MDVGETLPRSNKEKEIHYLKRDASLLHNKATGSQSQKVLMEIRRVTGSIRFQNLAVRYFFSNSMPSGNKLAI
eukprot:1156760-Pelagomonas_calceolata.AAC.4